MRKILGRTDPESFRSPYVKATLSSSKIYLERNESEPLATFKAMYAKRQPTSSAALSKALTNEGFALANLGISIILELDLVGKGRFAVFTRRGDDRKCLALISGYWDVSIDLTPRKCAERELLEELLVFDPEKQSFLEPEGFTFPFPSCKHLQSSKWRLEPFEGHAEWVPSAKMRAFGLDNCYIYIDATTSSAQAVYSYRATFQNWQGLSILHAEDRLDKQGNLVTTADDESAVLFKIQHNRLLSPAYQFNGGVLEAVSLPEDVYFHPAMVGVNQFGIVSNDKAAFESVVSEQS